MRGCAEARRRGPAGAGGEALDWLRWSEDSARIAAASFEGVDTMLMGRKTFEAGQRLGGGPKLKGVETFVFSRTLGRLPGGAEGELVRDDVAGFVRQRKAEPGPSASFRTGGGIIVMGGGELGLGSDRGGPCRRDRAQRASRAARRRSAGVPDA